MKHAAILTAGLIFLHCGPAGASVVKPINDLPNQTPSAPAAAQIIPASGGNHVFISSADTKAGWLDDTKTPRQKSSLQSQSTENSDLVGSPHDDGGVATDFSASEPVASSSGPAPTEAPMPRAGWIGLAGVLGVMAARSFSAARRSRYKSAAS